jgi:hypothetical protein
MHKSKELSRSIWSSDEKYLMMSHAKFKDARAWNARPIAKAVVLVFEGDPLKTGDLPIFSALSDLHSFDLLDELQNAERIGRDFLTSIR